MPKMSKRKNESNNNQFAYINGCSILQRTVWRLSQDDLLTAMINKVSSLLLRDAILLLINIRKRLLKLKMRIVLNKWLKSSMKMNEVINKRNILLKLIILAKDAKYKALLAKYFQKWKSVLSISEKEILNKYGTIFKLLDNIKNVSLKPIKKNFFERVRVSKNPTLLKNSTKKCFELYDKNIKDFMKKILFNWRISANKITMKEIKKCLMCNITILLINRTSKQSLLKALKNWHNNVLLQKIEYTKIINLFVIYAKWKKDRIRNLFHSALFKWHNNILKKHDSKTNILNAKIFMLKYNINKNSVDLLNGMEFIHSYEKGKKLLRKFLNRKKNLSNEILRKILKKWYYNTKDLTNKNLLKVVLLKHAVNLNDLNNRNFIDSTLIKTLNIWRRNCIKLKIFLSVTEKAFRFILKAAASSFFYKLKQKMLKDLCKKKFTEIMRRIVKNSDKALIHWWLCEWRKKAKKLQEYNIKALLINSSLNFNEEIDKLRALKNIQKLATVNNIKYDFKQKIIKIVFNKYEDLGEIKYREKFAAAFYRWKSNICHFKSSYEVIQMYKNGGDILQRFVWSNTHFEIFNAFGDKLIEKAKKKMLIKLLLYLNKKYLKDLLRKFFYRWRINSRRNNSIEKLHEIFEKYILTEPVRNELMMPYKDIVGLLFDWCNEKQKGAKDIEEFLIGIKEFPSQIRSMKIMISLAKLCKKRNYIYIYQLISTFKEWARKTRILKAQKDARIIQKYLRKKLIDATNKNKIVDILTKYIFRKNNNNMQNLRDKFDHWRNLLSYLRKYDAAEYIQACYRGKKFRDDLNRENKIIFLLRNIITKYALKNGLESVWQKWKKNIRFEKCNKDSKIIQHFLRHRLQKKLKKHAKSILQNLFKNLFFKKLTEIMKKAGRINLEAAEKLYRILMGIAFREPFNRLKNAAKWKEVMNKIKCLPDIFKRFVKGNLKKYFCRWYANSLLISNQAANKIQAVYQGYLFRKTEGKKKLLIEILTKLFGKYIIKNDEKKLATLMKWNKNTKLSKCGGDSVIIQRFCRKIRNKLNKNLRNKWADLAKNLFLKRICNFAKIKKLNDLLSKLLKKKYLKKLLNHAIKERFKDLLNNLVSKYNNRTKKKLLKQILYQWRNKVKNLNDFINVAANNIQRLWRGYKIREILGDKYKLQSILIRLLQKILLNSRNVLLTALQKWAKNAKLNKCNENSNIIQDFSKKLINKLHRLKYHKYLRRINEGLKKLENLRPNTKLSFDLIRNEPKENAFHYLMDTLKNIFNKRKKDILNGINKYITNLLLSKLLLIRKNWITNILRKKFMHWNNIAQKLKNLILKLKELLVRIIAKYSKNSDDLLRHYLNNWKKNVFEISKIVAVNKIIKFLNDRFKIYNVRKIWKNLATKLRNNAHVKETIVLINGISKLKALNDLFNNLNDRIKEYGYNQLKSGNYWLQILDVLRQLFGTQNERNKNKILKKYLNKWKSIVNKLNKRENKVNDALKKIEKRLLIKYINDIDGTSVAMQIVRAATIAKIFNFLDKLKKKYNDEIKLRLGKDEYTRKLIKITLKQLIKKKIDYYKKKLQQWKDTTRRIAEEADKKRISNYITKKYLNSNTKKNWKKLCYDLDFQNKNKHLHIILKKLKKIMSLNNLANTIDTAFKKSLFDQLKNCAYWASLLRFLKNFLVNWDNKNKLLTLKHYLSKWNNKSIKLQKKDFALNKALNSIKNRILINDINIVNDVSISSQTVRAVPVGRVFDFLKKLNKQYKLWKKLYSKFSKFLEKYIGTTEEVRNNLLRRKLRQWRDNVNKLNETAEKNLIRIAKWIEKRYKLSNAKMNWKDSVDKYDLFKNNNLLYKIRKKLKIYALLKKLTAKLRNKLEKLGNEQFKRGVKFLETVKFLKKIFRNLENKNNLLILKRYFNKWKDQAKKLKRREEKVKKSFDIINLKNLTNNVNIIKNTCIIKNIGSAIAIARFHYFLKRLKETTRKNLIYSGLAKDLAEIKKKISYLSRYLFFKKLYKIYFYKIIENFFNKLKKFENKYRKHRIAYFFSLLSYSNMLNQSKNSRKNTTKKQTPKSKNFIFKAKKEKHKHVPTNQSVLKMLLPSFVKFLNNKILEKKHWSMNKLQKYYRANQFAKLYKIFSNKRILQPKRDLIDLINADHLYMNGLGASYCDLFKLLRKYWVMRVSNSLKTPSRVYKLQYLIKMVMMHKAISYQRLIREMVRKWRFTAFISCLIKRKLELIYKDFHLFVLQMINEIFGDNGCKNASVVKEFERFSTRMGIFINENYNHSNEENYCEKVMKKYIFQPIQALSDKEIPSNFFFSGIVEEDSGENNVDYYVDQDTIGETIGKYKQDTSRSINKFDKKY